MFSIDTPTNLILGLATGIVFGMLLQRGAVTRYRVIVGQFLWVDHTVLRTMLTAVVVGSVGVYAMHQLGDVALHVKAATLLANALGGILFGIGMLVLGYCPGTGVAALGDGSRHAIAGIVGMLVGAAAYAEVYAMLKANLLSVWDYGKVTLPDITGLSPWIFISALAIIAVLLFRFLNRTERKAEDSNPQADNT
ncbi:putative inner membrane protein [Planctomycetes bacterium CA13]|uniref:Putative inner membrane protein n=1 Tax=Novipirellula herctigrandis TaxID=2527986 RepID=A0A5C5YY88_9BACT|nr:putative inner membrane protein [Planctomycetes bacterium CA13]